MTSFRPVEVNMRRKVTLMRCIEASFRLVEGKMDGDMASIPLMEGKTAPIETSFRRVETIMGRKVHSIPCIEPTMSRIEVSSSRIEDNMRREVFSIGLMEAKTRR